MPIVRSASAATGCGTSATASANLRSNRGSAMPRVPGARSSTSSSGSSACTGRRVSALHGGLRCGELAAQRKALGVAFADQRLELANCAVTPFRLVDARAHELGGGPGASGIELAARPSRACARARRCERGAVRGRRPPVARGGADLPRLRVLASTVSASSTLHAGSLGGRPSLSRASSTVSSSSVGIVDVQRADARACGHDAERGLDAQQRVREVDVGRLLVLAIARSPRARASPSVRRAPRDRGRRASASSRGSFATCTRTSSSFAARERLLDQPVADVVGPCRAGRVAGVAPRQLVDHALCVSPRAHVGEAAAERDERLRSPCARGRRATRSRIASSATCSAVDLIGGRCRESRPTRRRESAMASRPACRRSTSCT